jgi:prepilin-type N-terminal cleavage/methylation domain-containing protein
MKKVYSKLRGFTLIELLVVIAIIALLTGIILTSLTGSKAKARDAERVSDINQLQLALELYFDRCHQYPAPHFEFNSGTYIGSVIDSTVLNEAIPNHGCVDSSGHDITLSSYISVIPQSPAGGSISAGPYDYLVNDNSPTDYILHTALESVSSASANSLTVISPAITLHQPMQITPPCDTSTNYCVGPK